MSLHPDADALVRAILDRPADDTPKLVLADWLDDTGRPEDASWAAYIRSTVELARHSGRNPRGTRWDDAAVAHARAVRAVLTIPADTFVRHARQLLNLLPGPNIQVRLETISVPWQVCELVPESVVRENLVMPILATDRALFVAATQPWKPELVEKLEFVLSRDVVAVRGDEAEVIAAIDRHYGQAETESVDCVSYESPLIGLEGDEDSSALFGVFFTSFSDRMTGFELELVSGGCRVRYLRGAVPQRDDCFAPSVYHRLRSHLESLRPERRYRDVNLRCRDLHIPLLSGRPFPVTVECERGWRPRSWFRVHFRW